MRTFSGLVELYIRIPFQLPITRDCLGGTYLPRALIYRISTHRMEMFKALRAFGRLDQYSYQRLRSCARWIQQQLLYYAARHNSTRY